MQKKVWLPSSLQYRANHHAPFSFDISRVSGLSVWEARPRHPHWHELLRGGSARGQPQFQHTDSHDDCRTLEINCSTRLHIRCLQPERRCRAAEVSPGTCTRIWPPSMRGRVEWRDGMAPSHRSPSSPCPTTVRTHRHRAGLLPAAVLLFHCVLVSLRHHSSHSGPDGLHHWGTDLRGQTTSQQTGNRSVTGMSDSERKISLKYAHNELKAFTHMTWTRASWFDLVVI